jgi:peptide/nickel transport system permease protein
MVRFILRRGMETLPLLLAVVVVNFIIIQLTPGDPVQALVGNFTAPPEYIERVRREFGLDQPAWRQLLDYVTNVAQGNLGYSFANRRPVAELILDRAVNTLILTVTSLILAAILGIVMGVSAAQHPHTWQDTLVTTASMMGFSIPVFWLGQILILFFAVQLGWLPAQGMTDVRATHDALGTVVDVARHLALPALALSVRYIVSNARLTRASMLEAMGSDYIVTARAKGVPIQRILYVHALRNAMVPVITSIGYNFGFVLAGSALVETVFAWPGLGRLLFDSMSARDTPVILGIFLVAASMAVLANLTTDLAYGWLDPRIRRR